MPKRSHQRRPPLKVVGHQGPGLGTDDANGSRAGGAERRPTQGISSADAELILTVLREVRKGNVSVRMPVTSTGVMARIAAEMNGIIELNILKTFGQFVPFGLYNGASGTQMHLPINNVAK